MRKLFVAGVVLVGLIVLALIGLAGYSLFELRRFERAEARRSTFLYAAGQPLAPGVHVRLVDLAGALARLKYAEVRGTPKAPGQFSRRSDAWELHLRGVEGVGRSRDAHRVRLDVRGERIVRVTRDGREVDGDALEPEVLGSAAPSLGDDHRPVRVSEVPLTLLHAIVAVEDHRFFEHAGLDFHALVRAAWANLRAGRVTQGGSTLTQQLVKNRLLSHKRTFGRKLNEAWLATLIEWRYPKEQILEAYLNEIYLGQRGGRAVRGVGAATRAYFGKEMHQLTLGEAAVLAGMIRAPNTYSPAISPERARDRRDIVLGRLRELGKIDEAAYRAARSEPVRVQAPRAPVSSLSYYTDYVRQEVERRLGGDVVSGAEGARIFTTLDMALQRFAETAVARGLDRLESRFPRLRRQEQADRLQAALVALDPNTGQIRALIGGRDYHVSQYNRAALARRQPGSAFKPFVYLAALSARRGPPTLTPASRVDDSPITLTLAGQSWVPRNYEDRYEGLVSVRRALEQSLNAATVRIAQGVGLPAIIETARSLGIESELAPVPALALGAFEVTPLELARAYLPFASGGRRPTGPRAIRAAYYPDGSRLELAEEPAAGVLSPDEAYLMTALLQGVVTNGTGAPARAAGVPAGVAGKTGTTNDGRDAWFVGYSSNLVTLVWVGFDSNEPHRLSGAEAALPIWSDFMKQALESYPAPPYAVPIGITIADVDTTTGLLATRFCPVAAPEMFLTAAMPPECTEHSGAVGQVIDWWQRFRDWFRR
jgi:penicillin-binding protein 1B